MTAAELYALLPLLIAAATPVAALLLVALRRSAGPTFALTLAGLLAAFVALCLPGATVPVQVTPLLVVDGFARYFMGLTFAAAAVVALLARSHAVGGGGGSSAPVRAEEFYILLATATLGAAVLAASCHFASFFLGLEILSVSLYALVGYRRDTARGVEAALKYLVLAGVSSAFLLFGMALVFAVTGTLAFPGGAGALAAQPLFLAGAGLMLVGIGFKLAVVPFHFWTPDVYEGAPAPVTAYVATVSKGATFAVLLRLFAQSADSDGTALAAVLSLVALASMVAGNLLALLQDNVKRILAYSSIAHLGYVLVAFLAGGQSGALAAAFYLAAYFVTTLGAFGVVTALSTAGRDADDLADYRGLFWRRPWLAAAFTAMLLSLAGIPLTVGFVGKFYLILSGVATAQWALVVTLALTSAVGLFYYLRIVAALYAQPGESAPADGVPPAPWAHLALAVLALLLLGLGVYPTPLFSLLRSLLVGWR